MSLRGSEFLPVHGGVFLLFYRLDVIIAAMLIGTAKKAARVLLFPVILALALGVLTLLSTASPTQASPAATRYYAPPAWTLGPWVGWIGGESSDTKLLDGFDQNNIPYTVFHFDWYTWQTCPGSAQFAFSDAILQRLQSKGARAIFWYVPLIAQACPDYASAAAQHYFVEDGSGQPIVTDNFTGQGSWVNYDNPAAVSWLHGKWDALLAQTMVNGVQVTGGFYTDNVRPDLINGAGTPYQEQFDKDLLDYTRAHIPDGEVIMKHFGANTPDTTFLNKYGHAAYVGDEPTNFAGMIAGIQNVLQLASVMPAPFNEFTSNAYSVPDPETYIRRIHWGALQVVMDNSPAQRVDPFPPQYSSAVLRDYKYYSTLHLELVPYLHSYDQAAYENNTPIILSPNQKDLSMQLGNEIFAKYVTGYVRTVNFALPSGTWINFWNEAQKATNKNRITQNVPLGQEPIWIRNGAIIPLAVRDNTTGDGTDASIGSLTVRVYPNNTSTFRYYDPNNYWVTFQSQKSKNSVTLCTTGAAPSQPLIYKISRLNKKPQTVTVQEGAVGVNRSWGSALPKLANSRAVQGSTGGWFYDSGAKILWVKVAQPGTACPAN